MRRFNFDFDKGLEAILYIATRVPSPTFHKVSKILYFADLDHLDNFGRFVTGDRYIAMEYGPVPSNINNVMRTARGEKQFDGEREVIKAALSVPARYTIRALREARTSVFSKSDIESLDRSIAEHGRKSFGRLVDDSHDGAWHATPEGQEMPLPKIVRMLKRSNEILEHLELTGEQAA